MKRALLVDYEYCDGCGMCEDACNSLHGTSGSTYGIKVLQLGPLELSSGNVQSDCIPILTDLCDLCMGRIESGSKPSCVKRCHNAVISIGTIDELSLQMKIKPKMLMFTNSKA